MIDLTRSIGDDADGSISGINLRGAIRKMFMSWTVVALKVGWFLCWREEESQSRVDQVKHFISFRNPYSIAAPNKVRVSFWGYVLRLSSFGTGNLNSGHYHNSRPVGHTDRCRELFGFGTCKVFHLSWPPTYWAITFLLTAKTNSTICASHYSCAALICISGT